jgi:hypothetical protein
MPGQGKKEKVTASIPLWETIDAGATGVAAKSLE